MKIYYDDWNKLHELADKEQIGVRIYYLEACGELELETISAAPVECYYEKRTSSIDDFIENYYLNRDGGREAVNNKYDKLNEIHLQRMQDAIK